MKKWTIINHLYDYNDNDVSTEQDDEQLLSMSDRVDLFMSHAKDAGKTNIKLIICEGDSWFDYCELLKHITNELRDTDESDITWGVVDIANSGDTLKQMIKNSDQLKYIIQTYKQNIQCVLFSAAGNDVIEEIGCVLDIGGLKTDKLKEIMDKTKRKYEKIINIVHNIKKVPIFTHSYAYFCNFGSCDNGLTEVFLRIFTSCPWISSNNNGLTDEQTFQQLTIVLNEFYKTIKSINGITIADTRESMNGVDGKYQKRLWMDEIHPTPVGSEKVAQVYVAKILAKYPNLLT